MNAEMKFPTVITIHGVGDAEPGSTIKQLAKTMVADSGIIQQRTLVLDGCAHEALVTDSATYAEMNWGDVQRPSAGIVGLTRHFLYFIATCLYLGDDWQGKAKSTRFITRKYRLFFEAILFWSVLFPPFSLLSFCLRGPNGGRTATEIAVVVLYCIAVVALTVMLRRLRIFAHTGAVWCCVFLIVAVISLVFRVDVNVSVLAKAYCAVQLIGGSLLLLSILEVLLSHRTACRPWAARFARIGFLTIPMLFVACVGPALFAAATTLIPMENDKVLPPSAIKWCSEFEAGFNKWTSYDIFAYDFALSELLMTITVGAIPVLGLVGVGLYFLVQTGTFARSWLYFLLIASPVVLTLNSLAFLYVHVRPGSFATIDWNVIETYRFSALRILPFVPFLIGPLLIIFDIVGDVAFYVLPMSHPLSSRTTTIRRLWALLRIVPKDQAFTVYAHSQGSVIAADTLSKLPERCRANATLITLGSPIASLYEVFLDITPGKNLDKDKWMNFFRKGDYVGGSIVGAHVDLEIGSGGHTRYWDDPGIKWP